jgi:peptidyl-prolyl cis-trans isomerase D
MITWMQHHKKYLVVTLWISTIAFVGAGFVGWGQYSYGKKTDTIAEVGNVQISMNELQQTYSNLYGQYNQMFQGKFDEEQAKTFGLQRQAMRQLIDQALITNLADSYNLNISDKELYENISSQNYFFKDGSFDKVTYKNVLSQNKLTIKDYEDNVRKSMLIQKSISLFEPNVSELERSVITGALNIQDKLKYKILDNSMVKIDLDDKKLEAFWSERKTQFMNPTKYSLSVVTQESIKVTPSEEEISKYYDENRHDFKDSEGIILALSDAKDEIIEAISSRATHKESLKKYIDFKKEKLDPSIKVEKIIVDETNHNFSSEIFSEIKQLTSTSPYMKPREVDGKWVVIKFNESIAPTEKSFSDVKSEITKLYTEQEKITKLETLASTSYNDFRGHISEFVGISSTDAIETLTPEQNSEFLNRLFESESQKGYIKLADGKIVLYNILEQKMLEELDNDQDSNILKIKSSMFNKGIIKLLENRYPVQIFMEGF